MTLKRSFEPVHEPCPAPTIFVDGLCTVTAMGGVSHLTFTARQVNIYDAKIERHIQVRLIVPSDQLQTIGRAILAGQVVGVVGCCAADEKELH
jgi:hypothetical protein